MVNVLGAGSWIETSRGHFPTKSVHDYMEFFLAYLFDFLIAAFLFWQCVWNFSGEKCQPSACRNACLHLILRRSFHLSFHSPVHKGRWHLFLLLAWSTPSLSFQPALLFSPALTRTGKCSWKMSTRLSCVYQVFQLFFSEDICKQLWSECLYCTDNSPKGWENSALSRTSPSFMQQLCLSSLMTASVFSSKHFRD